MRSGSALSAVATGAAAVLLGAAAPAAQVAAPPPERPPTSVRGTQTEGGLGVHATQTQYVTSIITGSDGTSYASSSTGAARAATTRTELRDACSGAGAEDGMVAGARDPNFCGPLRAASCGGDPTQTLYQARTVSLVDGGASDWSLACIGARDAAGNPVAAPVFTVAQVYAAVQQQFESITPATGGAAVRPEGRALLNYPAIFYATQPAPPSVANEGLLFGVLPFRVEGRPVRHDWLVDGGATVLRDTHEGRAYTERERVRLSGGGVSDYYVGFTFSSTGEHEVALRTTFAGTATVTGFGTFALPGTVTSTGPTTEFEVVGAQSELIR